MMETTLYIYIAARLALTSIPKIEKNSTCKYNDSILVGELCYRPNFERLRWKEARDNCVQWNGNLATFTSLDHLGEVFTALATCKYNDSILVGELCYRPNFERLRWKEARDNCVQWNGNLATFTSLDHLGEVFTALGSLEKNASRKWDKVPFWVSPQNEAKEIELQWTAYHRKDEDAFLVYFGSCDLATFPSICIENKNKPVSDLTSETRTIATTQADLTTKVRNALTAISKNETCLHNDSVAVDGQCFRLSTESLEWSNASDYCKSWNGTLATISSTEQGINVLTAISKKFQDNFFITTWITNSLKNDKHEFIGLSQTEGCRLYRDAHSLLNNASLQALCVEKHKVW